MGHVKGRTYMYEYTALNLVDVILRRGERQGRKWKG
jgi:hypothetical protein